MANIEENNASSEISCGYFSLVMSSVFSTASLSRCDIPENFFSFENSSFIYSELMQYHGGKRESLQKRKKKRAKHRQQPVSRLCSFLCRFSSSLSFGFSSSLSVVRSSLSLTSLKLIETCRSSFFLSETKIHMFVSECFYLRLYV